MVQRSKIWRFSGVLRWAALGMAVLNIIYAIGIWGQVLFENKTRDAFDYVNIISTAHLEPWQIILGITFTSIHISAYIVICLAANQFLKASKQAGFFIKEVKAACRKLGYGLLLYWFGLNLVEDVLPGIMSFNFPEDQRREIDGILLNHYVIVLVGVILLLMAQAIQEARVIDSDNKQFI